MQVERHAGGTHLARPLLLLPFCDSLQIAGPHPPTHLLLSLQLFSPTPSQPQRTYNRTHTPQNTTTTTQTHTSTHPLLPLHLFLPQQLRVGGHRLL